MDDYSTLPEDFIAILLDHDNAKRLARLFRMIGTYASFNDMEEETDGSMLNIFDEMATSLGSHMRITSNSDHSDELDESLDMGDEIEWRIYDSFNMSDNASPTHMIVPL